MLDNRSTGNSESEVAALADRVATARGKLPLQSDPALFAELSEAEIAAERELAEWMRTQRRKQRRRAVTAELAAEKRDRRVALALRRDDEDDARWHRRALASRRRVANPDARLAQLYRRAEWSSRALIGVVVLGMLWAGVNVQHNLVPSGDMADPLYWLSYGFEAMISIPIITIMVVATTAARWGREIARGKVVFLEVALLGVTIALNAGPHLAAGALARAAEAAVAPVMVGVVIWLHAWVSARYAQLIEAIPAEAETTPDDPSRQYPATTVEFGELCPTFAEFAPGTAESAALPIGHTFRPDSGQFGMTAGQFVPPAAPAPQAAAAVGDSVTAGAQSGATDMSIEHAASIGQPQELRRPAAAANPAATDNNTASVHHEPAPTTLNEPAPQAAGAAVDEPPHIESPDSANGIHTDDIQWSNHTAAQHPYEHRQITTVEPTTSPRPAEPTPARPVEPTPAGPAERGTQLSLDEQPTPEPAAPRRPHIVPTPNPVVPRPISHDFTAPRDDHDTPEPWDDTDEAPAEFDDGAEVWTVARELSERRLSKLPVEQLAEVLTLAEESWTPAAIGASIGLPGSRILGILEAARRLRGPYAISG
ncbi:hypothetical protein KO481_38440 [Nocardia sp. NEAU-G5]|uniref:DUF2637 domain-containing protein n=1 Tax=Nocardia albiluteola TaxID=2842303 RepID=A0ABS6BAT2_9NOCA|nr:hypothetical protein [Nocardia albiluteola]MBU3067389.1 hypothetical protein [Nocardia albiluteola]